MAHKNTIKILLLENIHKDAIKAFKKCGYNVESLDNSLSENALSQKIKDVDVLCIRSKTNITQKNLDSANKLMAIGTFCIGTSQVDLDSCGDRGIAVFNAPFSNTRSVVEMIIGEIVMLCRGIFDKSKNLHKGAWEKSAKGNFEIRGKKLGIIGYGNIGSQLSVLAEALGMDVYYYDILEKLALGNATKCKSRAELLREVDIVSVHVDDNPKNKNLIGEKEFKIMKDGVLFLNSSRGFVVNINALEKYIKNGKISGTAIDVFPKEPKNSKDKFKNKLQNLTNVILTPHIGGSTEEAQKNIADFVCERVIRYIKAGNSFYSVNLPNIQLPGLKKAHRLIHIHKNVPGILAEINSIMARHNINIVGQYLKTTEKIGYVITDVAGTYSQAVIEELRGISNTIKLRILY